MKEINNFVKLYCCYPSDWSICYISFVSPLEANRQNLFLQPELIQRQNYFMNINVFSFSGVILIKKAGDGSQKIKGCWDSIHVVEVVEKSSGRNAHYKLTSTAMLWLQTNKEGSGTMNLGGSLTRQVNL